MAHLHHHSSYGACQSVERRHSWYCRSCVKAPSRSSCHTMALVLSMLVSGLHYTTSHRAAAYLEYMHQYVFKLHDFYPHIDLHINKHVAFHIYNFLLLYGPVQSWWCFPFKCLVGALQNLLSNHQFDTSITSLLSLKVLLISSLQVKWKARL